MMMKNKLTMAKYIYLIPMCVFSMIAFASPKVSEQINSADSVVKNAYEQDVCVSLNNLDDVDLIKIYKHKSSKIGNGEKMKLNADFTVTLTNKTSEGQTFYYMSVLNAENKVVSQKCLGKDDVHTLFDLQCKKGGNTDTLLYIDAGCWTYHSHYGTWENNLLMRARFCSSTDREE